MINGINHIGIAVIDLDKTIQFFEQTYRARLIWRIIYADQKIESAFIAVGQSRFELTASIEPQSVIDKFVKAKGEGIHHISLEVGRFDEEINDLKAKGLQIVAETDTENFKGAFIHPNSNCGILTEIIQPKREIDSWGN